MFSVLKLITVVLFSMLLMACGTTQEPQVMYKVAVVTPDDNMLIDCVIVAPPEKNKYYKATMKEREEMLIELSGAQIKETALCNNRWKNLRLWKKQQQDLHSKPKGSTQ